MAATTTDLRMSWLARGDAADAGAMVGSIAGDGDGRSALNFALAVFSLIALAVLARPAVTKLALLIRRKRVLQAVPLAPESVPILGHALTLMKNVPWDKFCEWARNESAPLVRINIMDKDLVLLDDPQLIKQVFQSRMSRYGKDTEFTYYPFMPILGSGLVTAEGPLWRKQRSMVSVHFRVEILDEIVGISKRAIDRLVERLEPLRGTGKPSNIAEEFRHLTLQVIGEAILSMSHEEADRVLPFLYLPIMEEANLRSLRPWREFIPNAQWFRHRRRIADLDAYIVGVLRKRWSERYPHAKLAATNGDGAGGAKTSLPVRDTIDRIMDDVAFMGGKWNAVVEKQLCYEVKTFMLAGHETSAAMLAWSLYELTQNPACLAKVREEADRVFPTDDAVPTKDEVEKMDYTYAVLKETLRKYSVVPTVVRVSKAEDDMHGYKIPPGTHMAILIQGVHHRPDIWPEPDKFKPERFLAPNVVKPYTFLPFIDGPRNCLGQHLALIEGRVMLAYIVKRFKFEPFSDKEGQKHATVIPIAPRHNMRMLVE